MPTVETPPTDRPVAPVPEGWPEVVWSDVWLGYRSGQWYAICVDFDVVGTGASNGEALREMSELADDYIELCIAERLTYSESLRRLPLRERVKLRFTWLVSLPLRLLHRGKPAREGSVLLRPNFNGRGC